MPLGCINRTSQTRGLIASTGKSITLSGDAKNGRNLCLRIHRNVSVSLNEVDDQHPLILHLEESNPRVHPSPIGIVSSGLIFYDLFFSR